MSRFHVFAVVAALLAVVPLAAQESEQPNNCGLSMTLSCGTNNVCTSTTVNGPSTCGGTIYTAIFLVGAAANGQITGFTNSLGLSECFNSSSLPVQGEKYALCFGESSLPPHGTLTASATVTGVSPKDQNQVVAVTFIVDDSSNPPSESSVVASAGGITDPCLPVPSVDIASPAAGQSYKISWTPVAAASVTYTVVEKDPSGNSTTIATATSATSVPPISHVVTGTYTYTVTPSACASGTPETGTIQVKVVPPGSSNTEARVPVGSTQPVSLTVPIPGQSGTVTFTATTDQSFLSVNPPSGTVPPSGTTVTVTANPTNLPAGTNTGTLKITTNGSGGSSTTTTPIQISIVTPVSSGGLTPTANALVIPVVTHVNSASGPFVSDVRLTNAGTQPASYLVTMAPAGSDATVASQTTTITVAPQSTAALNDIVKNFFGIGANPSETGFGSLQIRPIDATANLNFASSRTYTIQSIGTFGQFIAATQFAKFATLIPPINIPGAPPSGSTSPKKLSLQQVSSSQRFRTNFGLVEGAGQPASGIVRVFDDNGNLVNSAAFDPVNGPIKCCNAGQILQQNLGLTLAPSLTDGRIEVEVTSQTGAVTAYASVIDNGTTDPFAVEPVDTSAVSATRYVLPGIAELNNGASNFHSDARIYNAGTTDVNATLTFYPSAGSPGASPKQLTIPAGHVAALDSILPNFFGVSATGGSVVVTTPSKSSLVATANTYTNSPSGTFGQFIPGVQSTEGIGVGDRPLEILQLEESDQFRSNIGLTEITGNPVNVEVTLYLPDSKATPVTDFTLGANEFRQFGRMITQVFGQSGQTYNGRISVQVTGGTGRVAAYGSVIDNHSSDPTYVPAQ